ncbi:MAG: methionyl-tRNA formyltransferase [Elusimicrobiota bacterium]
MRILFFGTPALAAGYLRTLLESARHDIAGVVTRPDAPQGRGQKFGPSAVKALAAQYRLGPVFTPTHPRDADFSGALSDLRADIAVVVAYGKILPETILSATRTGFINVHFSLLPKLRGPSPAEYAILEGHADTGVSLFWIDQGMDTGPLLAQQSLPISPKETAPELLQRLERLGQNLLLKSLDRVAQGTAPKIPQNHTLASYSKIIKKEDGLIEWSEPAIKIECKIRAYAAWPKCWSTINGDRLQILKASAGPDQNGTREIGQVLNAEAAKGFFVKCGIGEILVETVCPEGGRPMPASAWLAGRRNAGNILRLGT